MYYIVHVITFSSIIVVKVYKEHFPRYDCELCSTKWQTKFTYAMSNSK